jgi:microcystin-dependent protein
MGGPSANRVTDIAADAIGGNAGTESKTITTNNLPEHEHDLEGESGTQFYGIRVGAGEPVDDNAIELPIEPGLGGTQGIASSGGIKTESSVGDPLDVMNPFLAVNYIIYTGQ